MAELCAGSPKIMRCEVVELQPLCTAPDYVPDDVFGYAATPDGSVTTDCIVAGRPDVLTYRTEALDAKITVVGPISVHLEVSSSGTDFDFIVKLIDEEVGSAAAPKFNSWYAANQCGPGSETPSQNRKQCSRVR